MLGAMAAVALDGPEVVVRLSPMEKMGALHGDVRLPRAAVLAARVADAPMTEVRGLRMPGSALPWVVALGTWRRRGAKDFVAVRHRHPGVVVELDPHQAGFSRLLVSVADPEETVRLLSLP